MAERMNGRKRRAAGRMGRPLAAALMGLATLAGGAGQAGGQPLIADLSEHLITITSSYTGTHLLLFGTVEQKGDVIVVVRGPEVPLVVRRKERIAGIWVNRDSITFNGAPGYYAIAATRPFSEFASETLLTRLGVGTGNLRFEPAEKLDKAAAEPFRAAVVRNMQRSGLYLNEVGKVTWLGGSLFRTEVRFPSNVPVGNYQAEVYLISNNEMVSAQTTPLFIRKTGIERAIFEAAHKQPFLYGVGAVLLAIVLGWLASLVFRRT